MSDPFFDIVGKSNKKMRLQFHNVWDRMAAIHPKTFSLIDFMSLSDIIQELILSYTRRFESLYLDCASEAYMYSCEHDGFPITLLNRLDDLERRFDGIWEDIWVEASIEL